MPPSPAPPAPAFKKLFVIAIIVAVTWGLFLAGLAVTTANPVTVNREQVLRADFIAMLSVNEPESGAIVLEKLWDGTKPEPFTLDNLKETGAEAGRSYYVPVTKTGQGRYIVTPTRLPGNPPLIYPATPEAEEQLTAILEGR